MSKTLLTWLNSTQKKSFWYYWKLFWKEFWSNFGTKDVKINNDWKGIKLSKTIIPEGWTKENAFKYLGKEYEGTVMKRFTDKKL